MSRCSTPLPLPSANNCSCVRSPITSRRTATDRARLSDSRRARCSCPARYCAPTMVRSRSRVPPITGTAIAAITTHERRGDDDVDEGGAAARRASREAARLVTGRLVGLGRDGDERLQLQEALLADALDVHQLFDPLEAAALGSILDDAFGGLAADAGQRFELIDRRGVEIDRRLRRRGGGRRRGCAEWWRRARASAIRIVPQIASTVARLVRMVSSSESVNCCARDTWSSTRGQGAIRRKLARSRAVLEQDRRRARPIAATRSLRRVCARRNRRSDGARNCRKRQLWLRDARPDRAESGRECGTIGWKRRVAPTATGLPVREGLGGQVRLQCSLERIIHATSPRFHRRLRLRALGVDALRTGRRSRRRTRPSVR